MQVEIHSPTHANIAKWRFVAWESLILESYSCGECKGHVAVYVYIFILVIGLIHMHDPSCLRYNSPIMLTSASIYIVLIAHVQLL